MIEFKTKVLSREIAQAVYDKKMKIGTAESCTGGRLAESLIAVPGSSNYYEGGVIAYSEELKKKILGVDAQVIEEQTCVCEEVARQMVLGTIEHLGVDIAVATTGTAGPSGGTPEIPVGTIWIAVGTKDDIRTMKLTEDNGRDTNLSVATNTALQMLLDFVRELFPEPEDEAVELTAG